MTQIRIDTEHTREVARRLIAESDHLSEIGHELQNAIGGLDTWAWDGRSRSRAEPLLSRVRPESEWVKHQLEELGYKLVRVTNIFEQEDREAAGDLGGLAWDIFPPPIASAPALELGSLPSLFEIFDVLKASLSTITLFVTSLELESLMVFTGAVDFFIIKLPRAERAFQRWEKYNDLAFTNADWDRETARQYEEEAKKALEDLGIGALRDTLDLVIDKLPKNDMIDEALKKTYDAVGTVQDWIEALGGGSQ